MSDEKKTCPACSGTGGHTYTRQVPDTAMGSALGSAMGMGYFPFMKTETYRETCYQCGGTGVVR